MNGFFEMMAEETAPPMNVVINIVVSDPNITKAAQAGLSVTLRENELHLVQDAMPVLFASAINKLSEHKGRREGRDE